jgi:hypothetical protein
VPRIGAWHYHEMTMQLSHGSTTSVLVAGAALARLHGDHRNRGQLVLRKENEEQSACWVSSLLFQTNVAFTVPARSCHLDPPAAEQRSGCPRPCPQCCR